MKIIGTKTQKITSAFKFQTTVFCFIKNFASIWNFSSIFIRKLLFTASCHRAISIQNYGLFRVGAAPQKKQIRTWHPFPFWRDVTSWERKFEKIKMLVPISITSATKVECFDWNGRVCFAVWPPSGCSGNKKAPNFLFSLANSIPTQSSCKKKLRPFHFALQIIESDYRPIRALKSLNFSHELFPVLAGMKK